MWAVTGLRTNQGKADASLFHQVCDTGEINSVCASAYRLGFTTLQVKWSDVQPVSSPDSVEGKLLEFFKVEGASFARRAELEGWDPAETAIRAMREYMANVSRSRKVLEPAAEDSD